MPQIDRRPAPHSRLKLAQLRLIAAIDDRGSVSAAAEALHLSQPAASRMVAELEATFAAQLCERLARGVRLTPLGLALARHARAVLLQIAEAERELGDLRDGRRGVVAVGAVSGPAFNLMPAAVLRLRDLAPEIELSVKIDSSNVMARDLLAGRLDLMLGRVPEDIDAEEFDAYAIGVEEAKLLARRGHPLVRRKPAELAELSAFEWVMQPAGTPLRRAVDGLFLAANLVAPRRILSTTSLTMTMMTVARSDAIAPVSHEVARFACGDLASGRLTVLKTAFPLVVQPYSLISARRRPLSPAAATVYQTLRGLAPPRPRV